MKTHHIEVQRIQSLKHAKGVIEIDVQALVLPRPAAGESQANGSQITIPLDHARALFMLLKHQFAELDKLQPRSRRSGRS